MIFDHSLLDGFGGFWALNWAFGAPGPRKSDPRGPTCMYEAPPNPLKSILNPLKSILNPLKGLFKRLQ